MNIEKIKTWIDENSGFFGGEFPPAIPADTYFTESNFLGMGYSADEIAEFLVELDGDWDRLATIADDMVDDEIANRRKYAASLGRKGGQAKTPAKAAAAKARANVGLAAGRKALAALTPEQRSENARKAAKARWSKKGE